MAWAGSRTDELTSGRFFSWLRDAGMAREQSVRNLVWNFYEVDEKRGSWIYPMLSGKAILWLLGRGQGDAATAVADSLLRWQQTSRQGKLVKSYGAFPSKLEPGAGGWKRGERYYSGDNLVILEALCSLYVRTKEPHHLDSAVGIGTWLTEVMCKGREHGVWAEDHGAPMWFVTSSGDFGNQIHGNVEALWIGALLRLGKLTGEQAYCRQAERAFRFYRGAQLASGAFLDHYEPDFPPRPYDPGRWRPYQEGQVIADSSLRAALGACRMGNIDAARRFFGWIQTENGAIPAYLDLESGKSGFAHGEETYYDVTSTGLHRNLCHWLGERRQALTDGAFLGSIQQPSGAWFWGVKRKQSLPVRPELAPIAGFWATADLAAAIT